MTKTKLILPAALIVTGLVLFAGVNGASAQTGTQFPPMIQALVDHFKLNPTEVQQVVNETKQNQAANREKSFEDHLTALINEGKLTDSQKQAIITKLSDVRNQIQNIRNSSATASDKRTEMQKVMTDLRTWVQGQGLDWGLIRPWAGRGHGGPFGGPMF